MIKHAPKPDHVEFQGRLQTQVDGASPETS